MIGCFWCAFLINWAVFYSFLKMGWNAMTLAALKGNIDVLDMLLGAGVPVDTVDGMGYVGFP